MPAPIGLCADDFALHPEINRAVSILALKGVLNCTSAMTESTYWKDAAQELKAWRKECTDFRVGLHFNLTENLLHPKININQWIINSYLRKIDLIQIKQRFEHQFQLFIRHMDELPEYIDGHQHIHQLPGIREVIIEILDKYDSSKIIGIRNTVRANCHLGFKARTIEFLGGHALAQKINIIQRPSNSGFAGVYDFKISSAFEYGKKMNQWQTILGEKGLIMCHPATAFIPGDPISPARQFEFEYLLTHH